MIQDEDYDVDTILNSFSFRLSMLIRSICPIKSKENKVQNNVCYTTYIPIYALRVAHVSCPYFDK